MNTPTNIQFANMVNSVNLSLHGQAWQALNSDKPENILSCLDNTKYFPFILKHQEAIYANPGWLERFVVDAFTSTRTNNYQYLGEIQQLLDDCHRPSMLSLSDPMPHEDEEFTVYRGINYIDINDGHDDFFHNMSDEVFARRQGVGFSWTADLEVAKWFANRYGNRAMVIKSTASRDEVFFYSDCRNEQEYVLNRMGEGWPMEILAA